MLPDGEKVMTVLHRGQVMISGGTCDGIAPGLGIGVAPATPAPVGPSLSGAPGVLPSTSPSPLNGGGFENPKYEKEAGIFYSIWYDRFPEVPSARMPFGR